MELAQAGPRIKSGVTMVRVAIAKLRSTEQLDPRCGTSALVGSNIGRPQTVAIVSSVLDHHQGVDRGLEDVGRR